MGSAMIVFANSAGDHPAAWIVGASLDAALLLAFSGLTWCAVRGRVAPQVGCWLFRNAPGAWSVSALVLLAVVLLPQLRAAGDAPAAALQEPAGESAARKPEQPKPVPDKAGTASGKEFELRVVGPTGEPIPGGRVELRTDPAPTAGQVRQGTFIKQGSYGSLVATDAQGRLLVTFPKAPTDLDVNIMIPGYGPYWASWSSESHTDPIPPRFTAELDAGWPVGGIIVDAEGKPVAGVQVSPSIEFKKRPGDQRQMRSGARAATDAAGRWRFDSVPVGMSEVFVEIDHAGFMPLRRPLTRGEFEIERGREPMSKIVLDRGLTVTGTVTDEAGKPIAGALIRTKLQNNIREVKTGADGTYRLTGCEPRTARIVVSARGRATDMKELTIAPRGEPVDFQMKPGGTVRIRVLDQHGDPVPRARIFFQRWRGRFEYFEFKRKSQYADQNGVWVWNEAPLDEFEADICSSGSDALDLVSQPLIARAEEYVFRLPAPLVVAGKVSDAETGEPIKVFRVIPGIRSSAEHMNWVHTESFLVADGSYQMRQTRGELAYLVRVEADGYHGAVSRDIKSTEGNVTIDFALKRGKSIDARVVTPDNRSAAGAKVALGVAGSQINVNNGDIEDGQVLCAQIMTDGEGRFRFPAQDSDFQLVITHPSGYLHIKSSADWGPPRIIRLEPWVKVEGTFRVGQEPLANVPITIGVAGLHSYGDDVPRIFAFYEVTSGPGGRFVFDRVIAGPARIGRRITMTVDDGAAEVTSSGMLPVNFPGGGTVPIDLGGTGRPVVGRLLPPDGFPGKMRWSFALVSVESQAVEARGTSPHFMATVGSDGRFRIDDVPPGNYSLRVEFTRDEAGALRNHRFRVPPPEGAPGVLPVDLGMLWLEKR